VIGIVIVSHSAKLADGVLELAREMAGPGVKLAAAGGLALPGRPLGTDPVLVAEAIRQVYGEDGVVVLMDLGSAVLSAEMALELLPPGQRERVALCGAPLVEGAVSAAVQARMGGDLARVVQEAGGALAAKAGHLGAELQAPAAGPDALEARILVANRLGLHARPAARFVQTAGRFPEAHILVRNLTSGRGPVEAKSINAVATLGLSRGQTMGLEATGPQAAAALAALRALAEDHFGDGPEGSALEGSALAGSALAGSALAGSALAGSALAGSALAGSARPACAGPGLAGLSASNGMVMGPARHLRITAPVIPQHTVADPRDEWGRLLEALERTRAQIRGTLAEVARRADRDAADMFEAHLLFLDDPALRNPALHMVFDESLNAAAAWHRASEAIALEYRALEDGYLRARAADVMAVAAQVAAHLLGGAPGAPTLAQPGILIAPDLTPDDTARLDPVMVRAICTAHGAPTSHSAILARTFGIPAIVGLGEALLAIPEGTLLLVDAGRGLIELDPDEAAVTAFLKRQEAQRAGAVQASRESAAAAITRDGRRVEIGANIGSLADARAAVEAGAEGVGLLRTEFLFTGRASAPDEAEQYSVLCDLGKLLDGRPMVVRTLDVGGDKPLPFLDCGRDANPFLGWRAIRLSLSRPDFFKVQLRAIVRAAALYPLKVMFPMVATLGELRAAKALLAEAAAEVAAAGRKVPARIETGVMVEIPATALRAHQFAPEVDFFSIGTNDLTQYTMAAERGNARLAALADPFQPAVLDLVRKVVEAGHAHDRKVAICGELGGDVLAIPLLVGLGIDELSMSAPMIPGAKQLIRELDCQRERQMALRALRLEAPDQVRAMAARRDE
jgi:phosphocarrier protein FPr